MRKPSFPRAEPWHAPVLQPVRRNTGITSRLKLVAGTMPACSTTTGTDTACPSNSTRNSVFPSARAVTVLFSIFASFGSARVNFACAVTSCVTPSAPVVRATRSWPSRWLKRWMSAGKTSSFGCAAATASAQTPVAVVTNTTVSNKSALTIPSRRENGVSF